MAQFFSTQHRGNYEVRSVIVDSKDALTGTTGSEPCEFIGRLSEQINLTGPTEIYLSSIYIGGYKINENVNALYDDSGDTDIIKYFSLDIPEFDIAQIGGQFSSDSRNSYTDMNRRFNLVMESPSRSGISGVLTPKDYKPFVLGHLGKTAVYVSTIKPKTLNRLTVNIQDQDGLSIFRGLNNPGNHSVDANPPAKSRRVILQFLLVETQRADN